MDRNTIFGIDILSGLSFGSSRKLYGSTAALPTSVAMNKRMNSSQKVLIIVTDYTTLMFLGFELIS